MNKEWLFLLLGILIPIIYDVSKPWIKSAYDKSIFSSRKKRLDALYQEYKRRKRYKENPQVLYHDAIQTIFAGLVNIVYLLFAMFFWALAIQGRYLGSVIGAGMFTIFLGVTAGNTFKSFYLMMNEVKYFWMYEINLKAKYKKLGGNPEDLDKEESTG